MVRVSGLRDCLGLENANRCIRMSEKAPARLHMKSLLTRGAYSKHHGGFLMSGDTCSLDSWTPLVDVSFSYGLRCRFGGPFLLPNFIALHVYLA